MKIRGDLKVLKDLFIKAGHADAGKTLTVDGSGKVIFGGASEITVDTKKTYTKGSLVSNAAETGLYLAKANGAPGSNLADAKWEEIGGGKLANDVTVHGVGKVGAVKDGDIFVSGMDTEEILRKLLTTVIEPTLSLNVKPTLVEIGSTQNVELTPSFKKNDAGTIGDVNFFRGGSPLTTVTGTVGKYTDSGYKVPGGDTTYKVTVNYAGNTSTGLSAGSKSATGKIKGINAYFGYSTAAIPSTGAFLRSEAGDSNRFLSNTFSFQTGTTNKTFVIAVPAGRRIRKITDIGGALPVELKVGTDYIKSTALTTVPDAGGTDTSYDVYIFVNAISYDKPHTHKVEL